MHVLSALRMLHCLYSMVHSALLMPTDSVDTVTSVILFKSCNCGLCATHETQHAFCLKAEIAKRLANHRAEQQRRELAEQKKDQLRVRIRQQLALKLGDAKSLRQVLTAFRIPVDGGFLATPAQLEKAYKKAMILFHPDKHVSKGLEKQIEAEEAFKIISHARNRKSGR